MVKTLNNLHHNHPLPEPGRGGKLMPQRSRTFPGCWCVIVVHIFILSLPYEVQSPRHTQTHIHTEPGQSPLCVSSSFCALWPQFLQRHPLLLCFHCAKLITSHLHIQSQYCLNGIVSAFNWCSSNVNFSTKLCNSLRIKKRNSLTKQK